MAKGLVIVVVDQPMTHAVFSSGKQNSITLALTEFMLDLSAAMARDDYETRHKRQAQGIAKAKVEGNMVINLFFYAIF
jgi:DNA invertase Pin-like site-specific DNA recombinase